MQKALLGSKGLPKRALDLLLSLALAAALVPAAAGGFAWASEEEAQAASQEESCESCELAGRSYVEDEIVIVYEDEALDLDEELDLEGTQLAEGDGETSLEDLGVVEQEEVATFGDGEEAGVCVVAELDGETSVEELVDGLACDPDIAYVQPNYLYEPLTTTTNDPYSGSDSGLSTYQYYLEASGFTEAWDEVQVNGSATVAVVDTGCNLQHEDLRGTLDLEHAFDVDSGRLLAQAHVDNNGDAYGHGTLVCGVISAFANNATGIAGASYNATLLPVRIYNDNNEATSTDAITAYTYLERLIDQGELDDLCVINMSLGYYATEESDVGDQALEDAIAEMLEDYGVLTVCAGGNGDSSNNAMTTALYPADFEECVSVTSVDEDGANSTFSDYNKYKDISAYGEDILTTSSSGGYATASGTSLAAPQVSAAVALLYTADPTLTPEEIVEVLQGTADEVTGNLHPASGSAGILDVEEAVDLALAGYESADDDEEEDSDAAADDEEISFLDVQDPGSYYYEAVYALAGLDYVTGYTTGEEAGCFGVGDEMSRAEFVTLLWRIACPEDYAAYDASSAVNETDLPDVADGKYYTEAVNWAVENGVVTGYAAGDYAGRFMPNQDISFEQMCVVIARCSAGAEAVAALDSSAVEEALGDFRDAGSVSSWAERGMAWCVRADIVSGTEGGRLYPASDVTRERAAVVVYRAIDLGVL